MVTVSVVRSSRGIRSIAASGHAGYAERGLDIVCAGVSAVLLTALIGLSEVARAPVYAARSDRSGYLKLALPATLRGRRARDARLILATAAAGLKAIEREHPDNVKLIERKWRMQP